MKIAHIKVVLQCENFSDACSFTLELTGQGWVTGDIEDSGLNDVVVLIYPTEGKTLDGLLTQLCLDIEGVIN